MATADFAGKATSLAAVEWIDDDGVPYFTFGIPEPTTKPPDWAGGTAVLYIDLTAAGADAIISLVTMAYDSCTPLHVGLTGKASMRVAWVQLQK